MTSRSSVYFFSAVVGIGVLAGAFALRAVARAPNAPPTVDSAAARSLTPAPPAAVPSPDGWVLKWTHIDPSTSVRTFSMDSAGVVSRVLNATPAGVLDTVPRPLVQWATRAIDQAALCTMKSRPADWRLEVSVTAAARTCEVSRSLKGWRGDDRGRRVLVVVDSLEKVACRKRCSPFE
jgi:hypothetical protein